MYSVLFSGLSKTIDFSVYHISLNNVVKIAILALPSFYPFFCCYAHSLNVAMEYCIIQDRVKLLQVLGFCTFTPC